MIKKKKKNAITSNKGITNGNVQAKGLANSQGLINGKGLINGRRGLINGKGLINGRRGLINGKGLINGRGGLINGKGLINGRLGLINGNGLTNGLRLRKNPFGAVTHRELRIGLIFIVVLILLLPGISLLVIMTSPPPPVQKGINIDGDFTDWASVPKYSEALTAPPDNINLLNYAIDLTDGILSFYIKVKINFFAQEDPDMFEIFIDADGDRRTGYKISEDFGSDYRVELYGWNGTVKKSILLEFSVYEPDKLNYSAWSSNEGVKAAITLNDLETQIDTEMLDGFQEDDFKVLFYGKDFEGREVYSSVTPSISYGALVVEQKPLLQNPVVAGSQDVTQLLFTAKGSDVYVTNLTITASAGTVENIAPFTVPAENTLVKRISLDVTGLSDGILVSVNLNDVEADRPARIKGSDTRVYVGNYRSGIVVDGLFEDWKPPINTTSDAIVDVNNTNIDVSKYSTVKNSTNANFYLKVVRNIYAGTSIPRRVLRPEPGVAGPSGPPAPPTPPVTYIPRNSGEDVTRIYIDSNTSDTVGDQVSDILADYMVEIKGIHGKITSRAFYNWTSNHWNSVTGTMVEAEIDETQLESSIPLAYLGTVNNPEVLFVTTDWRGFIDTTAKHEGLKSVEEGITKEGTKSGGGPQVLHGDDTLSEVPTLSSAPSVNGDCEDTIYYSEGVTKEKTDYNFSYGVNGGYLYVCIRHTSDDTDQSGDYVDIMFDTAHDDGGSTDADDYKFDLDDGAADISNCYKGTGGSWNDRTCPADDDGANGFDTFQEYEFKIRCDDVWDSSGTPPSCAVSDTAGFGIHLHDATGPTDRYFGDSTMSSDSDPSKWADLTIPEFQEIIIPFSITIAIPVVIWRKKKSKG